ncbi:Glycosyl hydrolase family 20, domain 2 [Amycolatopsis arida]|uniref:Glycosyl hydrolase family 20, domain 2 n=1 Tax=Amycolatopsis arida TaxID=587909 RepID=A0A1I5YVG9_9PSEU|nr:beta-N-acetylglucosaminidase domain-containing protein [Amycolatopsis arida]TDX89918.1 glycosyl hydrolase family 20 [Amycolatopsis arida]SFQ48219.1 Glycosyl hydrolase family 20, domain 2 [Amycolatopsis arida]
MVFRVLLAVVLLVVPAPVASAAPVSEPAAEAAVPVPDVLPTPRSITPRGGAFPVPPVVAVVRGPATDPAAARELEAVLRAAGARVVLSGGPAPLTVWLDDSRESSDALRRMRVAGPAGLPAEGYVLAARPGRLVLAGVDGVGTFHAVQTLRQVLARRGPVSLLPSLDVRDWPTMAWRGVVEGFYGPLWSTADRIRQLDRAAATKLNTYVYAAKDDPYHRERWREPYPEQRLRELGEVAAHAASRHVRFVFAVSPGLDVCHSAPADLAALTAKAEALWERGVRRFALFFDDIGGGLHCAEDERRFGTDPAPLAAAQAHLLAEFRRAFLAGRPEAGPLVTVPTEYAGAAGSTYQRRFGELVEPGVLVYWTGPEVVSATVDEADAAAAHAVFRHDLLLWDNFPVNDFDPRRLFLGPLVGRSATLHRAGVHGLTANPMVESEPSALGLVTAADYAWNAGGYRPEQSWRTALRLVGGGAAESLRVFADANRGSLLDPTPAPELSARIDAFWAEHERGVAGPAARALEEWFGAMAVAPARLREGMGNPAFVEQAEPWLTKLRWYGVAGEASTRELAALLRGDDTTAWRQRVVRDTATATARTVYQRVAPEVMRPFLDRVSAASRVVTLEATPDGTGGLTLTAGVRSGAVPIDHVEFYSGDRLVGRADQGPYRLDWPDPAAARHVLTARAVAADGTAVRSAPVRRTVGAPDPALLVVGTVDAVGDVAVRHRLEELGLPVEVKAAADTTSADADGKALVVISSTAISGDVGTKFTVAPVPVLTWESFVFDDLGMAAEVGETWRVDSVVITDPASPLAGGHTGEVTVYTGPDRVRWGVPAPAAERAAGLPGDEAKATLFGYRTGDAMVEGTAPAPRIGLFLGDDGLDTDVVTAAAVDLFDTAVCQAVPAGCVTATR